ncbi:hypothetical protein SDC9_198650 [bioreactor metagenome]|uniref:Uncharacterized protein n=1 Tax=bioreactor metagenome TaxID=1076179 RepID=A0A645IKL5_9ZZZZ
MIARAAIEPLAGEALDRGGKARIDGETFQRRADAEDVLADVHKRPRGGAGEPTVLPFAKGRRVATGDHLAIDIRFRAARIADLLHISRAGSRIHFKRAVAVTKHGFGAADPRVVVAENARVFLISRRIGADFT